MSTAHPQPATTPATIRPAAGDRVMRIGCVSYLNAKPLIDGLEGRADPLVSFDVPSALLSDLQSGNVDIALCPVIDYFRSEVPLTIIPVGGIGCEGPTLTVRLFSRVPFDQVAAIHADTDSHTSVVLMQVILRERFGIRPQVISFRAGADDAAACDPQTLLLIGDKVVTAAPSAEQFPHQMDLGEAWHELTGLPFVFAVWMARQDAQLGELPALLEQTRLANRSRIDAIVDRYAAGHGWPHDLARAYLGHYLRFAVGDREMQAIHRFAQLAEAP